MRLGYYYPERTERSEYPEYSAQTCPTAVTTLARILRLYWTYAAGFTNSADFYAAYLNVYNQLEAAYGTVCNFDTIFSPF